jgi:hypothetical protein
MNRTQAHNAPNPQTVAPMMAGAIMTSGRVEPVPKCAPAQSPKNEAPQANSGVRSHPATTSACASQRGTPPAVALTTQALRTRESMASTVRATM